MTSAIPSPTGSLDEHTVSRFRAGSWWLADDRSRAGLPELVHCDGCAAGIVQRVVVDDSPDCGPSYEAVDGGSIVIEQPHKVTDSGEQFTVRSHYCPVCTAERAAAAAVGVTS